MVTKTFETSAFIVLKKTVSILVNSILIGIAARIQFPFYGVPFTLQTLVVLMIAAYFGAEIGCYSVLLYLAEGVIGLPVFANFARGFFYLFGPTGGYLLGFIPAVWVTGKLLNKKKKWFGIFLSLMVGTGIIFLCGYIWLSKFIGFQQAYRVGIYPFIVTEILKILACTFFVRQQNYFKIRSFI